VKLLRLSLLLLALFPALRARDTRVGEAGARGDGRSLDTAAIQRAIDDCHASGGGTVWFPTGTFLTGTIHLRSNVTLHLTPGAVLLGSPAMKDYPIKHLIYAKGAENIAIEGRGTIDGNGRAFYDDKLKPIQPRPSPFIEIWDSRRVRIENITIVRGPGWTIHPKNCDGVIIRGISLLNELTLVNTDGINIDSSRNVIISDCHIEAGDDCIVLKTTKRGDGPVQPIENVVVTNCILVSAASALKLGTESHADFRHVLFSNCVIRNSRTGIALLAKDGGTMEDVRFSNIVMTTAPKWGQGLEWPIVVDVERRNDQSALSRMRDIAFSDITVYSKGRIMAQGLPESPIEGLSFRNLTLRVTGYEEIKAARKMRGGANTVAAGTPDLANTPAALIFGYIDGLVVDGVTVRWPEHAGTSPARHVIAGEQVRGARLAGLPAESNLASVPANALRMRD
jgi:polygalacturonase